MIIDDSEQRAIREKLDAIDKMPKNCEHPVAAYNLLAHDSTSDVERMLNLIHIKSYVRNAKEQMHNIELVNSTDVEEDMPDWINLFIFQNRDIRREIKRQHVAAMESSRVGDAVSKRLTHIHMDTLKLHIIQIADFHANLGSIKCHIQNANRDNQHLKESLDNELSSRSQI